MREVRFDGIVRYSTGQDVAIKKVVNLYDAIDMVELSSLFEGQELSRENFLGIEGKCFDIHTNEEIAQIW